MLDICTPTKTTVLDQLADAIRTTLGDTQAESAISFSHQFYSVPAARELSATGIERLCATVLSYWKTIRVFNSHQPRIEVFNPSFEQHGWHSNHTIVQVHNLDMPFLVDSVRVALTRQELAIHTINNCVISVERETDGSLIRLLEPGLAGQSESVIHLEIDRLSDPQRLEAISVSLQRVLAEVQVAVTDFPQMQSRLADIKSELQAALQESRIEAARLLDWLADQHFVFLGYQAVQITGTTTQPVCSPVGASRLGSLRLSADTSETPAMLADVEAPEPLLFAKDVERSRVQRSAYRDMIVIRRFSDQGRVIGEHHFLGLYTAAGYRSLPAQIPVVRRKLEAVLSGAGFEAGGHSYKQVLHILNEIPRDELLLASVDELQATVMGIFNLQDRRKPSLFIRQAPDKRYYSCLYYVPRDLYNTALRERVQTILAEGVGAFDVEVAAQLSESVLFRTHFVLYVRPDSDRVCDLAAIEARIMEASRSWEDDLQANLVDTFGEEHGSRLANLFRGAFPSAYKEHFPSGSGVCDIQHIQDLTDDDSLSMRFYQSMDPLAQGVRFKLYSTHEHVVLSDVIPILENLGMRVLGEHPYRVERRDGQLYWISDFTVSCTPLGELDLQKVKPLLQQAFTQIWTGRAENDPFNQLVIGAGLGWREVALLRAYARYIKQLRFGFSQPFIAETLIRHLPITRLLATLFRARFDPVVAADGGRQGVAERIERRIIDALDAVENLDDDRILRRFLVLIKATLRTNYYQRDPSGELKGYFSFKFDPQVIPDIPQPRPRFEVFVYSPRVEGVHLRAGRVARGGLRWSDRMEDYRTEVLGLVKAQQVKNSVIVPMGAKGCFIVKQPPQNGGREAVQAEGIACYQIYIRGLLDLTDNLKGGAVVPPADVVRHDDDDTYLVVAADKGTATFSDIANTLSTEYDFWLGDAFASGGSEGYDHKKMGITARGAWESVKRHFREIGIDTQTQAFSVVGIGDMGGDVFGNGMLLSKQIRLLAAFNHQHIFVDPNPDVAAAFAERQRLFELPRSSWDDYARQLISAGGGVFSRSAKWIDISPQMQASFGIDTERLAPSELISALLKAPVDMVWNGGIGTYVKAADESHADVGDKANDGLRVNGEELRCRVLGEGGNLGFTQRGRIEFALAGGAANTDFIDNAGGVDCSDHEVNIKILLNELVQQGDLTLKQRNRLLREMTEEVGQLVLKNNYRQALALNIAESNAAESVDDYIRLIKRLEREGKLDRALEFLPNEKSLLLRKDQGRGLTRPELSVLISYSKIELKQALVNSWITEDACFSLEMQSAFPSPLLATFAQAVDNHRLRKEITATQIANELVNRMGITYVDNIRSATGADYSQIAAAYLIIREVYGIDEHWNAIEALDGTVTAETQVEMMKELIGLIKRGSHWLLRHRRYDLNLSSCKDMFQQALAEVTASTESLARTIPQDRWQDRYQHYCGQDVPPLLGAYCAAAQSQYWLLDIIETSHRLDQDVESVASVYFQLGERLNLIWLDKQIRALQASSHWQALAAVSYRNELDHQLRDLTSSVFTLQISEESDALSPLSRLEHWSDKKQSLLNRWQQTLAEIQGSNVIDCAVFSVALSVLLELA